MNSISITAPCNGSGKTSLILSILATFPRTFSVAKFTTIYQEEQFCPTKDHDCACRRLQGDYLICTDPEVLSQPDTDTGRFWQAGALQTLWCVSRSEGYPKMIHDFMTRYVRRGAPLLAEGNSVTPYLQPQLRFMVVNPQLPPSWWKQDTHEQMQKANFVLLNCFPLTEQRPDGEWTSEIEHKLVVMEPGQSLDRWKDQRVFDCIRCWLSAGEN
jgi:hypothetical protein